MASTAVTEANTVEKKSPPAKKARSNLKNPTPGRVVLWMAVVTTDGTTEVALIDVNAVEEQGPWTLLGMLGEKKTPLLSGRRTGLFFKSRNRDLLLF